MTQADEVSPTSAPLRARGPRWSKLCLKELREILRDRRTLITLVLMPLLVYPILSMVFQRSLLSVWSTQRDRILIGVASEETAELLRNHFLVGDRYLHRHDPEKSAPQESKLAIDQLVPGKSEIEQIQFLPEPNLRERVRNEHLDLGVLAPKESASGQFEIIYRDGSPLSQRALEFVEQRMAAVNELVLRQRLREAGRSPQLVFRPVRQPIVLESGNSTLATIIPMILILMTVTGAVYPAIDLTAGERERGTLEMLMASPVPRLRLLMAKYAAVITVAVLTAVVNLLAMGLTLQVTGLSQVLFGDAGVSLVRVVQILVLLVLFAAFFSAVLLALTSFARSFKEAQAYLIPLMLLSLGPGIVSLLPGLQLNGVLSITPIANMVLLARDVFGGGVDPLMATASVIATGVYTLAAIGIAAKIFGTDAVMSGSQVELRDLFAANRERGVSTVSGALFCLAILFPIYFLIANGLGRLGAVSIPVRLSVSALSTSLLFGVIPGVAVLVQRLAAREAFQWKSASVWAFLAALLLGLTAWPIAHELVQLMDFVGLSTIGKQQIEKATQLVDDLRTISPIWGLLSMAVAPAVFEELFFRGYLFSAFRRSSSRGTTIVVTAVLFGLFHVLLNGALSIERFVPSTFMGLLLGWLCYQSGSVVPGMLLHACHNGLLLMIAYYKDELQELGWGVAETTHLPAALVVASVLCVVLGIALAGLLGRRPASVGETPA